MYILVNAFKNIGRNQGRNWLLLLLSVFIISMSGVSMLLKNQADRSAQYYTLMYGSKVSILPSSAPLDKQVLLSFSKSKLLTKSEKRGVIAVNIKNNKVIDGQGGAQDTIKWIASSKEEIEDSFETGEKKIIEGKKYQQSDEVLISKRLAKLNRLKVGDQLTLTSNQQEQVVLKISGIYSNVTLNADKNPGGTSYSNSGNDIYTSFKTMSNSSLFLSNGDCSIELFLKDPANISKLRDELLAKGMPQSYLLSQDLDTYDKKMEPVRQLQAVAKNMMAAVVIVGGILLILISLMAIKERMYEVGVLRSIGMPKRKIARGFIYESFIITMVALAISLGAITLVAKPVTNFIVKEETVEQSDISLSKDDLQLWIILSLTIVVISSAGGLFVIMRYEPQKILTS